MGKSWMVGASIWIMPTGSHDQVQGFSVLSELIIYFCSHKKKKILT